MDSFFGLDHPSNPGEGLALLTTCYGNEQLAVVEALLQSADIPYRKQARGAGGAMNILAGYSLYPTDLFVRECDLEAGLALLGAEAEDIGDGTDDTSGTDTEDAEGGTDTAE